MNVRVVIDTREDDLWAALEAWRSDSDASKEDGWIVERRALDVGDIAFYQIVSEGEEKELVILERKTAEDLGASQRDGRYREQRLRLLAKQGKGVKIGYMLETPAFTSTLSKSWCFGRFTELHLQNTILRLQLRYGIAVFHATGGMRETVQWIRRIAGAIHSDPRVFEEGVAKTEAAAAAAYTESIHVKKSANMEGDRVLHTILRTIPGVGATAADAIVKAVNGSFPAFYEMTEEMLAALPLGEGKRKLGKALATKIWSVFHTSASPLSTSSAS